MYCPSCGKKLAGSSNFCPFCGQQIMNGTKNDGPGKVSSDEHNRENNNIKKGQAFRGFKKPGDIDDKSHNKKFNTEYTKETGDSSTIKVAGVVTNESYKKLTNFSEMIRITIVEKRTIVASIVVIIALVFLFAFISRRMVDEPCDWCDRRPTMAFKTSDGSMSYVCSECRKNCKWCDKRATKHYENMLGMIVFVCDDCYKDVTSD